MTPRSSSTILVATSSMNARSWLMKITVPLYEDIKLSIQRIDSTSRWFVGSSRSSTVGSVTSARERETLRSVPPESVVRSESSGRCRSEMVFFARSRNFQAPESSSLAESDIMAAESAFAEARSYSERRDASSGSAEST